MPCRVRTGDQLIGVMGPAAKPEGPDPGRERPSRTRSTRRGPMAFFDLREPVSAWSHCLGLLLALPGILLLWRRSGGDHAKRLSLLVYGLSLAFCYTASTLYHGLRIPEDRLAAFNLPGPHRDLRPDRRQLHPAGLGPGCGAGGGGAPDDRLVDHRRRLGTAGDRRPSRRWWRPACTWGWGGAASPATPNWARVVSHRDWCPSSPAACGRKVGAVLNLLRWPVLWPGHRGPRAVPPLRAGGQPGPLPADAPGRRAVRAGPEGLARSGPVAAVLVVTGRP